MQKIIFLYMEGFFPSHKKWLFAEKINETGDNQIM